MKALIQRVKRASVTIERKLYSKIDEGLLVFLGVQKGDTQENADKLAQKLVNLRIFEDENEKMNLSLKDVNGQMLVVSQFTLCGDCKKGTRPSFDNAELPQKANQLYEYFVTQIKFHKSLLFSQHQLNSDCSFIMVIYINGKIMYNANIGICYIRNE